MQKSGFDIARRRSIAIQLLFDTSLQIKNANRKEPTTIYYQKDTQKAKQSSFFLMSQGGRLK